MEASTGTEAPGWYYDPCLICVSRRQETRTRPQDVARPGTGPWGTSLGTPRHAPEGGHLLDAQVDVLLDAEPEVAILGEVAPLQLVLLHLQTTLQDLLSLIERN